MTNTFFNLGKDTLLYGIGSVVSRCLLLFTLPLFTIYLSPYEYGVLAMLSILTLVAQPLFSLGISNAMGPLYFDKEHNINKDTTVWSVFLISFVSTLFLFFLAWSYPVVIGNLVKLNEKFSLVVSLTLTSTGFSILSTAFMQRVQYERQAFLFIIITILTALAATITSLLTVVFFGWGVTGMVFGQLTGAMLNFVCFFSLGLRDTRLDIKFTVIKNTLSLGIPLVPAVGFLLIITYCNKYFLEWNYGLYQVGLYSFGFNLGMVIGIIVHGMSTAWTPFYMQYINDFSKGEVLFGKVFFYYTVVVGAVALAFFIFAKPVVIILANNRFHDSYIVIGLIASAMYFYGWFILSLPGMYFRKETYAQTIVQASAMIISVPICFLLVKYFGILGAALGVSFGHLVMVIFIFMWNFYRSKDYPKIKYEWSKLVCYLLFFSSVSILYLRIDFDTFLSSLTFSITGFFTVLFISIQFFEVKDIDKIRFIYFLSLRNKK